MILQIKNSLAKAFSRKKNVAVKADSGVTAESDSISIHSDISVADSAVEYLPSPAVRTADWFVLIFCCRGVYNSWKSWKSPGILLMLLENLIVS